ncbi:NPC1 [Lepeophtheirus salmonis]|uniref:NPC1 n=1 Tax=Lepeophtheirus salmonis TaxID=72036 RepID=A0A7R8HAB8_LEPSM|nr:NPC1 [Lepeophtheirus salmonis]CAF2969365.1 NPC1 [Lepeophtheirus salmonis]
MMRKERIKMDSYIDILAFGIGGFSQLPALRNFCLYSSAGIFFVYFYIMTFFLGWFVIDARRVESHQRLFSCSGVLIDSLFFRGLAIIVTIVVSGFGVYGLTLIEPKFDPKSYINPESKLLSYFKASEQHFQKWGGIPGQFYILNPNNSLVEIEKVYEELKNSEFIEENSLRTFHKAFSKTINSTTNFQYSSLTNFLYTSRVPFDWAVKFKASQKPVCGDTTEDVKLSAFVLYFQHIKKTRVQDQIQSMKKIYQIGEKIEGERNGLIFPHATHVYCSFISFLADALTSIYVLLSILLSIIDVTGYMYFWGVSIDTASAVLLTVSLGLAVDYSAHIAHGYIHSSKSSRGGKGEGFPYKSGSSSPQWWNQYVPCIYPPCKFEFHQLGVDENTVRNMVKTRFLDGNGVLQQNRASAYTGKGVQKFRRVLGHNGQLGLSFIKSIFLLYSTPPWFMPRSKLTKLDKWGCWDH